MHTNMHAFIFELPKPDEKELEALDSVWGDDEWPHMTYRYLEGAVSALELEGLDPDKAQTIYKYLERAKKARQQWDEDSKDRPLTIDPASGRWRLFHGPWLPQAEGRKTLGLPDTVCATFSMPDGESLSYVEQVHGTFALLLEQGWLAEAKILAEAYYQYRDIQELADRVLCRAARHARMRLEAIAQGEKSEISE